MSNKRKGRKPGARAKSAFEWVDPFLTAYAIVPVVGTACEKAGVSRAAVYQLRDTDPVFSERMSDAQKNGLDKLEAQLHVRSRSTSDKAAMFLLAHLRPEVFGRRAQLDVNHTMQIGEATQMFRAIVSAVRKNVRDPEVLARIQREFERIVEGTKLVESTG